MSVAAELAQELRTSDRAIRRAVNRGTIRARRPTPNRMEIPAQEREYLNDHWPVLQTLTAALRTEPSVQTAILFGSVARGDDTDASDVDLLVQLRPQTTVKPRELARRLHGAVGRKVHVVTVGQAAEEPQFLLDILKDARPIIDRGAQWQRLLRRRAALGRRARQLRAERNRIAAETWATLDG